MALVPLRVVLDHAAENGYGVAAFNVNNMEQIQSIMAAAEESADAEAWPDAIGLITRNVFLRRDFKKKKYRFSCAT